MGNETENIKISGGSSNLGEKVKVYGAKHETKGGTVEMYGEPIKTDKEFRFFDMPPTVGSWRISGNLQICVTKKPSRIHKFFSWYLLGWKWEDE